MRTRRVATQLWALTALFHLVAGCDRIDPFPRVSTIIGESRAIGEGSVRSWVTLDRKGNPLALGITFSGTALAGQPEDASTRFTLALPPEAAGTPFRHVEIDWMASDHEPKIVFGPPHLDVHFYLVTPEEREAITDSRSAAQVPALDFIPSSYVPSPGLVPRVGSYWIDPTAPEFNGEPFTSTLLYGFYDGRMVFLESRIARAFLESRPDFTQELKLPRRYPRPGYYPTRYSTRYDAATREYSIALEGLARRP